jgi:hypothetical protein
MREQKYPTGSAKSKPTFPGSTDPEKLDRGSGRRGRPGRSGDPEDLEDLEDQERLRFAPHSPSSSTLSTELPLRQYVAKAATLSIEASLNADSKDQWKSLTWEFVRLCKSHPKLSCLTADEALEAIPWTVTDFGEDEQLTFLAEWSRVRILPGVSPLEWAARLAREHPLQPKRSKFKAYNEFISLAGWLQVVVGPDVPIFLPVRSVGDVIGKSRTTVGVMCKLALDDGLLVLVQKAILGPPGRGRAARYRFAVEWFEVLQNWDGIQ